jgi:hypothetical protein
MAEISKCMTSVAGLVANPPPSHKDSDPHTLWAQLLAAKLAKIQDYEAEELKIDIDKQVLALMKNCPK